MQAVTYAIETKAENVKTIMLDCVIVLVFLDNGLRNNTLSVL